MSKYTCSPWILNDSKRTSDHSLLALVCSVVLLTSKASYLVSKDCTFSKSLEEKTHLSCHPPWPVEVWRDGKWENNLCNQTFLIDFYNSTTVEETVWDSYIIINSNSSSFREDGYNLNHLYLFTLPREAKS